MKRNILQKIFTKNYNVNFGNICKRGYFNNGLINNRIKCQICYNTFSLKNNDLLKKNVAIKTACYFSSEKNELNSFTKEQIEEKVLTVLKKYLPEDTQINYNEELEKNKTKDNRSWDFLDTVEFLIDVESEFNITIPDETADNIKTVQEVIDYIVQLNTKKA
ncbi:mitochondrial ACP precursor, putative [Hepatocystis sp. ex Piliocolobus tephrosceles]|nr:mitochondrial ACP precursor, putative [Hepatocystis sp. ex Piliocolobus tephrosceles]